MTHHPCAEGTTALIFFNFVCNCFTTLEDTLRFLGKINVISLISAHELLCIAVWWDNTYSLDLPRHANAYNISEMGIMKEVLIQQRSNRQEGYNTNNVSICCWRSTQYNKQQLCLSTKWSHNVVVLPPHNYNITSSTLTPPQRQNKLRTKSTFFPEYPNFFVYVGFIHTEKTQK